MTATVEKPAASTLDRVAAAIAARKAARLREWHELVKQLADGSREPKPERVEAILAESGKTIADLEAAVTLHRRRVELAAVVARGPELAAERHGIDGRVMEANAALEDAERVYRETVDPLLARIEAIGTDQQSVSLALQELAQTADRPEITARLDQINAERASIERERAELDRQQSDAARAADAREGHAAATHDKRLIAEYTEEARNIRGRMAERQKALNALAAKYASFNREVEDLRAKLLEP